MATADFVVKGELGQGQFGVVFLIENEATQEKLALKAIDLSRSQPSLREEAEKEATLLRRLDNPYVVSYVTSYVKGYLLCIVTEFCEGGSLRRYLEKKRPLSDDLIVCWTAQITMALEYLHKEKVLHRDLKPDNIFLTGDLNICVGDLGIARVLELPDNTTKTHVGTPAYMSPERERKESYSSKADIWSLGRVVSEMMAGQRTEPAGPSMYSIELDNLVKKMMADKPDDRPDASSLLKTSPIKELLSKVTKMMAEEPQNRLDASKLLKTSPTKPSVTVKEARTAFRDKVIEVPLDDLQIHRQRIKNELRLVFVGKTGAGKSSTASTIAGRKDVFKASGRGLSMTEHCQCECVEVFGQRLVLVDTPGMFDTQRSQKDIEREIGEFFRMTAPGPHVILFVTSAAYRFTGEEVRVIKKLQDMFGKAIEEYLIVIVTRTEDWEDDGIDVLAFLEDLPSEAKQVLRPCIVSRRAVAFQNRFTRHGHPRDTKQVQEKLLDLIRNTVQRNGNKCYTEAHWKEAEEEMKRREQEILEKKMKEERERLQKMENAAKEKVEKEFETKIKVMQEKHEQQQEERGRKERETGDKREKELLLEMQQMQRDNEEKMEAMRAEEKRARAEEELRRAEQWAEEQRQREEERAERFARQAEESARQQAEIFKSIMEQQDRDAARRLQEQMELEKRRLEEEARFRDRRGAEMPIKESPCRTQ